MRNKFLFLLGLSLCLLFYYFNLIYVRPSRNIPFQLNIFHFGTLLWIVILYSFFLYQSIKSSPAKMPLPKILLGFLTLIREALSVIDYLIKYPIKPYYERLFTFLATKVNTENIILGARIVFTVTLIPRLILITIFCIDIFYFHKLCYFFKVIWISIFIFFPQYLVYCFKEISEGFIMFLEKDLKGISTDYVFGILPPDKDYWSKSYIQEEDEDEEPPHTMHLPIRRFFEFKYNCLFFNEYLLNDFSYQTKKECHDDFRKKHNIRQNQRLTNEQHDQLYDGLDNKINNVISLYKILVCYHKILLYMGGNENMKGMFTLIMWFYYLGWLFILIISIPTLSMSEVLYTLKILTPDVCNDPTIFLIL